MIEVRVRNQNNIDRGQIRDPQSGPAQPLQNEQPPGKIRVNDDVLSPHLQKEASMADERDSEFAIGGQTWFVRFALTGSNGRVPHQSAKLRCAFA